MRATRRGIAVWSLCACAALLLLLSSSTGVDGAATSLRLLRRHAETDVVATVDTTAGPTATEIEIETVSDAPHVVSDETGGVWHLVDGSHAIDETPVVTPTATPSTTQRVHVSSASTDGTHAAQVDLKEKADSEATSSSTSSSAAAAPHHKTSMTGPVMIGAIAILCVGVAAAITKRKQDAAAGGSGH